MTVYFRTLPVNIDDLYEDFIDLFFDFANTYTETSVLQGYLKEKEEKSKKVGKEELLELGYSEKDILDMNL